MSEYEIAVEKGIPVPTSPATMRWPLKEMKVNESFAIPHGKRGIVASHASRIGRETDRRFTIRIHANKETGKKEIRCWRIK